MAPWPVRRSRRSTRPPARIAPRDSLFLLTSLTTLQGASLGKARIRNLSATGMMADCEAALAKGQQVIMDLRGVGQVFGKIAWTRSVESVSSNWMDASHTIWFRSLLEQFHGAILARDYAGKEAENAFRCVELITTAYASALEGSRELPLGGGASP